MHRHIVKLAPQEAEVYNDLGNALIQKGRIDEAIVNYRKSLQSHLPAYYKGLAYATYYSDLGAALVRKEEYSEAFSCFQRTIELAPDSELGYGNMGLLYSKLGKNYEALQCFFQAVRINPGNYKNHYLISQLYYKLGDKKKGDCYYQQFLSLIHKKGSLLNK